MRAFGEHPFPQWRRDGRDDAVHVVCERAAERDGERDGDEQLVGRAVRDADDGGTFNVTVTVQDASVPQQTMSKVLTLTVR